MGRTTGVPVWRTSAFARLLWGATVTAVPRRVLRRLGQPTPVAVPTLRVLGLRNLAQALVTLRRPTPAVLTLGAATDGIHAVSALALAGLDRRQRRIALLDSAIGGGWILLDLWTARHPRRWTGRRGRWNGFRSRWGGRR
ncbi:MAG: hypothetical protein WA890_14080 [Micromonospora sp.]